MDKRQMLANKHKRLLDLISEYEKTADPKTRLDLRLTAMDLVRQIQILEAEIDAAA